jgi:hypothetical protein
VAHDHPAAVRVEQPRQQAADALWADDEQGSVRGPGVCSVEVPDLPAAVAALAEHLIATMPELQYIRLDLHAFNNEEDVARILDCFAGLRG